MKLLVTGGAGFIGSAFVRMALAEPGAPQIINLDKLTYAGNLENLESVAVHPQYRFVRADICDAKAVDALVSDVKPDAIVHFAAESHVDRSIFEPSPVFETNLRAAQTYAAYLGVEEVTPEHVYAIAPMALAHRLKRLPLQQTSRTVDEALKVIKKKQAHA